MKLFVVDAFTSQPFSGNQAGVALLGQEAFPAEHKMQALAAELKHSETAFVRHLEDNRYHIRYFTPEGEVALCGHATIASFATLHATCEIPFGIYRVNTLAGELSVSVGQDGVWMGMAPAKLGQTFTPQQAAELYAAYGLPPSAPPEGFPVQSVSTGLMDILLPVSSRALLDAAVQDEAAVKALSLEYDVVGVHMFAPTLSPEATCHCRNFAPRYAIPEECATGTSNGALTHYLHNLGKIAPNVVQNFIQGEKMGKPSEIFTRLTLWQGEETISVGGHAVVTLQVEILEEL